jgi:asparagine synthase (glutamine-hydrolysing)
MSDASDMEQLCAQFADAVRLRMRSDVPVGITLSGGLDSSSILSEAVRHTDKLIAYTSVFGGATADRRISEFKWAGLASSRFQNVELRPVVSAPDSWIDTLRKIAWHLDSPIDSPAVVPLWMITQMAKADRVPVLLEGQGGDELLGGYVQYSALGALDGFSRALQHPSPANISKLLASLTSYCRTFSTIRLSMSMIRTLFPTLLPRYHRWFGAAGTLRPEYQPAYSRAHCNRAKVGHRLRDRLLNDLQYDVLPGLLHYGDAVSMAQSIETRFPFLDYRFVETCIRLPLNCKLFDGKTKWPLRKLLERRGLTEIAERQDKKGYPTPVDEWLSSDNGKIPREMLVGRGALIHEFCEPRAINRLINMHLRGWGPMTGLHLYRLISSELWLQECIHRGELVKPSSVVIA